MSTTKLTRFLSYLAALILVLVPFQALLTTWLGSNFGYIDVFRIWKELLLVVLTIGCLYLVYSDKKLRNWFLHSWLVLLLIVYAALQLLMAEYALLTDRVSGMAAVYGLMINLRFLVFFLACLVLAAKSDWLVQRWKKLILWPAAIVVGFGLLQLVLPMNFLTHFGYGPNTIPAYHTIDQKTDYMRLQSTLRGPNPLGAYLVVIITVLAAYLTRKKEMKVTVFCIASGIVLFFTYSRSAWLGLVLSLLALLYLWVYKTKAVKKTSLIIFSVVLILGGLIFVFRQNDRVENTLFHTDQSSLSAESSNAVRGQSMIDGVRYVIEQPLGRGTGTAGPASFRNSAHKPRIAENYYIQIGQEVGVLGLILFIAINIYIALGLWKLRDQELARIALAALIGLTLVNMLSHAWADDTLAYIYWGLAGIALAPSVILNKERKHAQTKKEPKKRAN